VPSPGATDEIVQVYDTNVLGTHRVNKAVLPVMRDQQSGLLLWVSNTRDPQGHTRRCLGATFPFAYQRAHPMATHMATSSLQKRKRLAGAYLLAFTFSGGP